jgi:mannose-6-phosphate isomerase-like protein (cupin superfamily)
MKLLCCATGVVVLTLGAHALAQTTAKPAQTPPAQGQTPPAQGSQPQAPRRVPPRPISTHIFVRDLSGTPIEGARVIVSGTISRQATTDASGAATLASMRDGPYRLRFEREGFITLEREVTLRNGQPSEIDVALNIAPPPPPPPAPEPPPPPPPPAPQPAAASGPPVNVSIPTFLDKNFIGRDPLKESVLGCTSAATTRLLQLRDSLALHTHSDLDEILYVVAGEGTIHLRDESTPMSAGSLVVVPRGVPHAIDRRGKNPLIVLSTLAGAPCQSTSTTQSRAQSSKR